jgi:competence protein ComEA
MQLIETETGARELAGQRSPGSSSPARRGVGEIPVASRSLAARLGRLRENVWMPLCAKALGVLAGMLALAAIGASSLAKGPGVPLTASAQRAAGMTAGAAPGAPGPRAPRPSESTTPQPGVTPAADAGSEPSDAGVPSAALTPDGKVILNLASVDELRRLPGVGPKRAEAILALRAKLGGRFKRITDLLRVKGIGTKGLKKIEANAVLDAPKA